MKNLILLISFLTITNLFSQKAPTVILKDSSQLKLSSLKVNVTIIGNFATTTYDMKFYNSLDRTLEGELMFPLGEGQNVSNFSMDVNGKLREAVIVEKELARVAYESTIRQNIDPGLLEKTQGNNYKARVYPILPNSYKHLTITYEQELFTVDNFQVYELPLGIKETLDNFSLQIEVFESNKYPLFKEGIQDLLFQKQGSYHIAKLTRRNYTPSQSISVQIPIDSSIEKTLSFNNYFYVYKSLHPKSRLKSKPKKITLLWDASNSMRSKKLEKELQLLDNYFNYLQNVEVQFVSFSHTIHENITFKLKNGNWTTLKNLIKETNYDGGTTLNLFQKIKIKSDETLLFTDGLVNLGDFSTFNKTGIYTINSSVSSNHENLKSIATNSGGNYINLARLSDNEALKILQQETFQFLGIKHNKDVSEVYPFENTNVTSDFSISGRFNKETLLELLFGYRGKVTRKIKVSINKNKKLKLVRRLWAKQKIQFLNKNKEKNREAITALGKQYHLLTDYTSMLILDRVEDYAKYKIEPPIELKQEYKQLIKDNLVLEEEFKEELKERKEEIFEDYEDLFKWYTTKYPIKKKQLSKNKSTTSVNNNVPETSNNTTNNEVANNTSSNTTNTLNITNNEVLNNITTIDSTKRIVSGIITDETGPLPGVSVIIKGTNIGTETDFDGKFAINAEEDDILQFSYIGMDTIFQTIGLSDSYTILMEVNYENHLDEVVITALGVKRESKSMSYSTTTISNMLSGKASGINITGAPGAASSITIRGYSSISNSEPLYIIDGIPATDISTIALNSDDIESIQTLKAIDATKLYGSRAGNGLIIITTKKGKEKNIEAIDKLEKQIVEKIELKSWNPDTPYIKTLEKEPTIKAAYNKYLAIRDTYSNSPTFYLDVADFFNNKNEKQIALRILTNLIEIDLDNYELLKALGYKLEYLKKYDLATVVYEKILKLRPEEPQSYRDLALAYELNGEIQKSFNLLYKIYNGDLLTKDEDERFFGIEQIAFVELNRLVTKYKKKLKLNDSQKKVFKTLPVDIRIVIDWNHNDTDIDLWVIDPSGEKAYYNNSKTKFGGRISADMTDGYGPEEFMLKNALEGEYKVLVDYYSDNIQKISGPTILKATFFTNYGRKNETRKTLVIKLDKEEDDLEIGILEF